MLTHHCNPHTSALQKDIQKDILKREKKQLMSATNSTNCHVTKSQAIFKQKARQDFLFSAFIAHTDDLHHKTVGCNKMDSGINYRAVLTLGGEYLVLFIRPFITALIVFIKSQTCWFRTFLDTLTHRPKIRNRKRLFLFPSWQQREPVYGIMV